MDHELNEYNYFLLETNFIFHSSAFQNHELKESVRTHNNSWVMLIRMIWSVTKMVISYLSVDLTRIYMWVFMPRCCRDRLRIHRDPGQDNAFTEYVSCRCTVDTDMLVKKLGTICEKSIQSQKVNRCDCISTRPLLEKPKTICHQKTCNYLNGVELCAIKVSRDLKSTV